MLKGHSDILQPCGSLRPLRNFSLSEWRWVDLARGTAISQGSFPDLRIRGVGVIDRRLPKIAGHRLAANHVLDMLAPLENEGKLGSRSNAVLSASAILARALCPFLRCRLRRPALQAIERETSRAALRRCRLGCQNRGLAKASAHIEIEERLLPSEGKVTRSNRVRCASVRMKQLPSFYRAL
jgi:hypothetical protein